VRPVVRVTACPRTRPSTSLALNRAPFLKLRRVRRGAGDRAATLPAAACPESRRRRALPTARPRSPQPILYAPALNVRDVPPEGACAPAELVAEKPDVAWLAVAPPSGPLLTTKTGRSQSARSALAAVVEQSTGTTRRSALFVAVFTTSHRRRLPASACVELASPTCTLKLPDGSWRCPGFARRNRGDREDEYERLNAALHSIGRFARHSPALPLASHASQQAHGLFASAASSWARAGSQLPAVIDPVESIGPEGEGEALCCPFDGNAAAE